MSNVQCPTYKIQRPKGKHGEGEEELKRSKGSCIYISRYLRIKVKPEKHKRQRSVAVSVACGKNKHLGL